MCCGLGLGEPFRSLWRTWTMERAELGGGGTCCSYTLLGGSERKSAGELRSMYLPGRALTCVFSMQQTSTGCLPCHGWTMSKPIWPPTLPPTMISWFRSKAVLRAFLFLSPPALSDTAMYIELCPHSLARYRVRPPIFHSWSVVPSRCSSSPIL